MGSTRRALWPVPTDAKSVYCRNNVEVYSKSPHPREALRKAEQILEPGLQPAAYGASLSMAEELGASAYDARFLVVARTLGGRLVTEHAKLRRAAPGVTQSLEQALA